MPTVVCSTRALYPKDDININGVPMHGLRVFDNALVFVFSMCVWSLILGWGFFSCSNAISHLPPYNYAWNLFEAIRRRI